MTIPDDSAMWEEYDRIDRLVACQNNKSSREKASPRIAIIGSVDFYHPDSPALCDAIGQRLAQQLPHACLLTGANAITQKQLSHAFDSNVMRQVDPQQQNDDDDDKNLAQVFHLAPTGYRCDWDFGKVVKAGWDFQERRFLLTNLADICIVMEGGPGTSHEMILAQQATHKDVSIIPVSRTGGAASGMFDAPDISRPSFVPSTTWDCLSSTEASIDETADAVLSIVQLAIQHKTPARQLQEVKKHQSTAAPAKDNNDPPAMRNADLVFHGSGFTKALPKTDTHKTATTTTTTTTRIGNIYLGSKAAARPSARSSLSNAMIGGIVNCTNRVPCYFRQGRAQMRNDNNETPMLYATVPVNDEIGADIISYLQGATEFLHELIVKRGVNVLVHCEMGISRSSTVVIAYLIRYWNMSREKAFHHVQAGRSIVAPNPGFWEQLDTFEKSSRQGKEALVDKEATVASNVGATIIDAEWAKRCNAWFGTSRDVPELHEKPNETVLCLHNANTDISKLLSVSLDFVWGRGVIENDLDWLKFVCDTLDCRDEAKSAGRTNNKAPIKERVIGIIQDEDSEFGMIWSGEIYDTQINRVVNKLGES